MEEEQKVMSTAEPGSFYKSPFELGEHVDCLDTVNHWLNAEVISV